MTVLFGFVHRTSPNLVDTPFLGALLIFAGAFFSSWAMQHLAAGAYTMGSRAMLLWSAIWWYGPVWMILCNCLFQHYQAARFSAGGDSALLALYGIAIALSSLAFSQAAQRLAWPFLKWLGASAWAALGAASVMILASLY